MAVSQYSEEPRGYSEPESDYKNRGPRPLGESPPAPTPSPIPPSGIVSRTSSNLALVERATGGTLPTPLAFALSTLNLQEDKEYIRAAKIAARASDLPPSFIWGDMKLKDLKDPLLGGPMQMSTLTRITNGLEPLMLAAMIPQIMSDEEASAKANVISRTRSGDIRHADIPGSIPVKKLSRAMKALTPIARQYELDAIQAFGIGFGLIRDGIDIGAFARNIQALVEYQSGDRRRQRMDLEQLIGLAHTAAEKRVKFRGSADIIRFLAPNVAEAADRAQRDIDRLNTVAALSNISPESRLIAPEIAEQQLDIDPQMMLQYQTTGASLMEEAERISDDLTAEQDAWKNSFLGGVVSKGLEIWDAGQRQFEKAAVSIAAPVAGALRALTGAAPGGASIGEAWHDSFEWRDLQLSRLNAGQHLGEAFIKDIDGPEWAEAPANFIAGIVFDPTILAGRFLMGVRARKLVVTADGTTILAKPTLARAIANKVSFGRVSELKNRAITAEGAFANALTKLSNNKRLFRAALKSDDALRREMRRWYMNYDARRLAFDEYHMLRMAEGVRKVAKEQGEQAAKREWSIGISAHYGQVVPEDSIAFNVMKLRTAEQEMNLRSYLDNPREFKQTTFADLADDVISENAAIQVRPKPLRLEVPTRMKVSNPRRAAIAAMERDLPGSGLFNIYGGSRISLHDNPHVQFERMLRRSGMYSEVEINTSVAAMAKLSRGVGFEDRLIKLYDDAVAHMTKRYAIKNGLPEDLYEDLLKQVNNSFGRVNRMQTFGVVDTALGPHPITRPVFETQLRNFYYVPDPLDIKRIVERYTGTLNYLKQAAKKQNIPLAKTLGEIPYPKLFGVLDEGREIWHDIVRTWKFSVVPRPGYIGRVVLGDEAARFLATTGTVFERVAATHLDEATAALIRGYVTIPNIVTTPRVVAKGVGKTVGFVPSKVLDALWPQTKALMDDGTEWAIERPGRWDPEVLANTAWRESELADTAIRRSLLNTRLLKTHSWDRLSKGNPGYYEAWTHALKNQFGFSDAGKEAMRSVIRGETLQNTILRMKTWSALNGHSIIRSLGWEDPEVWAEVVGKMAHAYTMGDTVIAKAVIDRADNLDAYLRAIKGADEVFPDIHGPLIEMALGGDKQYLKRYVDYWYDVFVRMPENVLNRQPFYGVWKSRAERVYTKLAQDTPGVRISYPKALAGSAVRNADGTPIRVYHGTAQKFGEFSTATAQEGLYGRGLYFAEDPAVSARYAERGIGGPYIESFPTQQEADAFAAAHPNPLKGGPAPVVWPLDEGGFEVSWFGEVAPNVHFSYLDIKNPFDTTLPLADETRAVFLDEAGGFLSPLERGELESALSGVRTNREAYDTTRRALEGHLLDAEDWVNTNILIGRLNHDGIYHVGQQDGKVWIAFNEGQVLQGVPDVTKAFTVSVADREAIDVMSRDFALNQVKRIMFDFTENTRVGEMLAFVFPFMQPFFEAYAVWGHILIHRAPGMVGYVKQLARLGMDSGFIRRDPDSNELVIPTSWWMGQSAFLEMATTALGKRQGVPGFEGLKMFTYLDSMNLFFSSSFTLPKDGILGRIAGGARIPAPGPSPWAGALLKTFFKDTESEVLSSYLFQFGYNTPILPASWERVVKGVFPEWFNEDINRSVEKWVANYLDVTGTLEVWKQEMTPAEIQSNIVAMAQNLSIARGFASMSQLGASKMEGPQSALEDELWDLREKKGFEAGTKAWLKKHPEDALLTIGSMRFGPGITDPVTGEVALDADGNPIEGGVRIPYAEITRRLLQVDDIEQIANDYPHLVGAMILEAASPELAADYSWTALQQMLAQGWYKPRPLEDILALGEAAGPKGFWAAIEANERVHRADYYEEKYGANSEQAKTAKEDEAEGLLQIYYDFPFYAPRKLAIDYVNDEAIGASWKAGENKNPNGAVVRSLRAFTTDPRVQGYDITQGLQNYFRERDEIYDKMAKLGLTSLGLISAERAGITKRYTDLMDWLEETYPEAHSVVTTLLKDDLNMVPNAAEAKIKVWEEKKDPRAGTYNHFIDQYQTLYREGEDPDYDGIRSLINDEMESNPWVVKTWWQTQSYYERERKKQQLATLSPYYFSRWDWQLMGVDLTAQAADWLAYLDQARTQIFVDRDAAIAAGKASSFSTGDRFSAIDRVVRDLVKQDETFRTAVDRINTWGWQFKAIGMTEQPGELGKAWKAVLANAAAAQQRADELGLTGTQAGTDQERAQYMEIYTILGGVLDEWSEKVPAFGKQWDGLDDQAMGKFLFDYLMPKDYYFRLGG